MLTAELLRAMIKRVDDEIEDDPYLTCVEFPFDEDWDITIFNVDMRLYAYAEHKKTKEIERLL